MKDNANEMKRHKSYICRQTSSVKWAAAALLALTLLSSCELETSDNKKLDGYWRLQQVDTIATGGVNAMQGKRIFWAFQHKLLLLRDIDGKTYNCLSRFERQGDNLLLSQPYRYDREHGDEPLTSTELLQPYGVNELNEHFRIDKLSSSKMVLSSPKLRLHFVKF